MNDPKPSGDGGAMGPIAALRLAALLFVCWRGLLFAFDAFGIAMTLERPDSQLLARDPWRAFPSHPFWDSWARWDSGWYRILVERGYTDHTWGIYHQAFFPLYPLATRAVAAVVGDHWVAGLIVSNASLLLALSYLARIADRYLDPDGVRRFLIYMLIYPTSFFFSAYYSEGLFLLTTAASFHHYLSGRPLRAGAWGFLAALTRPTGLALFAAMAAGTLWRARARPSRVGLSAFGLLLIPAGLATFMALLYVKVGDPFAFLRAHETWGRSFANPVRSLRETLGQVDWTLPRDHYNAVKVLDAATAVLFLVLPLRLVRRYDPALPIYALLLILLPLSTGSLKSLMRLELVSFPAFLALAELGARREVDRVIIFLSAIFLGLLNIRFANWYWVG